MFQKVKDFVRTADEIFVGAILVVAATVIGLTGAYNLGKTQGRVEIREEVSASSMTMDDAVQRVKEHVTAGIASNKGDASHYRERTRELSERCLELKEELKAAESRANTAEWEASRQRARTRAADERVNAAKQELKEAWAIANASERDASRQLEEAQWEASRKLQEVTWRAEDAEWQLAYARQNPQEHLEDWVWRTKRDLVKGLFESLPNHLEKNLEKDAKEFTRALGAGCWDNPFTPFENEGLKWLNRAG